MDIMAELENVGGIKRKFRDDNGVFHIKYQKVRWKGNVQIV